MGLNTGIADVHNLAWKIALTASGAAADSLLDTYESERKHIALANASQSMTNVIAMGRFLRAIKKEWRVGSDGEGQVSDNIDLAAGVLAQAEHFDSIGLQLGYWYASDGGRSPETVSEFTAIMGEGRRLPHAWVQRGDQRLSSLDLLSARRFTLICGRDRDNWLEALTELDVPIAAVALGGDFEDPTGRWRALGGPAGRGAVLVRPDGHILAVFTDDSHPVAALARALGTLLGREPQRGRGSIPVAAQEL